MQRDFALASNQLQHALAEVIRTLRVPVTFERANVPQEFGFSELLPLNNRELKAFCVKVRLRRLQAFSCFVVKLGKRPLVLLVADASVMSAIFDIRGVTKGAFASAVLDGHLARLNPDSRNGFVEVEDPEPIEL
jgi:hypothetical protein